MSISNARLHDELLAWVGKRRFGIAGTVTFRPFLGRGYLKPEYLDAEHARACIRLYLSKLDRAAFGSAGVRKGMKVGAIAVREGADDWTSKHVHYHLALTRPTRYSAEEWADVARRTWTTLRWASPEHNVFTPMWSDQWLSYIFKTRDKSNYFDAIDFENWRLV